MPNDLSARLRAAYGQDQIYAYNLLAAADLIDQQAAEIERLQTALDAVRGAGWQPMETCPDSMAVLVAGENVMYPLVPNRDGDPSHRRWCLDVRGGCIGDFALSPTHWMPLPPPPETKP